MATNDYYGDPVRDYSAILSGFSWTGPETLQKVAKPTFLTYSFPRTIPAYDASAYKYIAKYWRPFTNQDMKDARAALKQWGDTSGITFLEVASKSGQSDIKFSWLPSATSAFSQYPSSYSLNSDTPDEQLYYYDYGGSVYLNTSYKTTFKLDPKFKKYILLHEIGHTLGLKHSFEATSTNGNVLKHNMDTTKYTVMSYGYQEHKWNQKLGNLDKQAIRSLYGGPTSDGSQASAYHWDKPTATLSQWGFETADGLRGTAVSDVMDGRGGNDKLFGFAGDDVLGGGEGIDTLIGGPGRDIFVFTTTSRAGNEDIIRDFKGTDDKIQLSRAAFAAITELGVLRDQSFTIAKTAEKAEHRIVYDDGYSGSLFYDPDGSGPIAQVKIAALGIYSGLTAAQIMMI